MQENIFHSQQTRVRKTTKTKYENEHGKGKFHEKRQKQQTYCAKKTIKTRKLEGAKEIASTREKEREKREMRDFSARGNLEIHWKTLHLPSELNELKYCELSKVSRSLII